MMRGRNETSPDGDKDMRFTHIVAAALFAPLLATGCVTTTTRTTTWTDPQTQAWARNGQVDSVREVVRETRGDPAGGAVAGAVIGGLVGSAIGGHTHYDRYGRAHHHGNPAGALVGAIGGAMIGANASQGQTVERRYEVLVRFDDGATETFVYANASPFRPGDLLVQTAQGIYPR
jgi:outer membrane lipoprotein SlyB